MTAICKTLSDHICLIMHSHFDPVFYSSHRGTACPVSLDSLNNPIKQVVQVPTVQAASCPSEICCHRTLYLSAHSASMYVSASLPQALSGGGSEGRRRKKVEEKGEKAKAAQIGCIYISMMLENY